MRSIDWSRRRSVRSKAGRRRCARWSACCCATASRCCSGGDREFVQIYNDAYRPILGRQAPAVDGPAGARMLGGDLAHHRPDGRGAVPRRAGDLERRPRSADQPPRLPRGDALHGRLQPGPRRDRRAERHRRRARDRHGDHGAGVSASASCARCATWARARPTRKTPEQACAQAAATLARQRRATCRSPSVYLLDEHGSTARLAGSVRRRGRERRRRAADDRARRAGDAGRWRESPSRAASRLVADLRERFAAPPAAGAVDGAAAHGDRAAAGVARSAARLRRAGRRRQPAPGARRRLPRLPRAGRRRRSRTAIAQRARLRGGAAARRGAGRARPRQDRLLLATSATSSARRSR